MNKNTLSAIGSVVLALAITIAVLAASGWKPTEGATLTIAAANDVADEPTPSAPTASTDEANLRSVDSEPAVHNRLLSETLPPASSTNQAALAERTSTTTKDVEVLGPAPTIIAPSTTTTASPLNPPAMEQSEAQSRGADALATIQFPWKDHLDDWTITFSEAHEGAYGYTYPYEQRIEVFVRPSMTNELLRHVIAHEIGHAIDVTLNTSNERDQWAQARQIPNADWWPDGGASDFSTGAGDFAESFAFWQVGGNEFRSTLGSRPTDAQLDLLAELASG